MNKVMIQLHKDMARDKWYSSKEHFNSEKSYEEHLEDKARRKNKLPCLTKNKFAKGVQKRFSNGKKVSDKLRKDIKW